MVHKWWGHYNCLSCNPVVLISNGHQESSERIIKIDCWACFQSFWFTGSWVGASQRREEKAAERLCSWHCRLSQARTTCGTRSYIGEPVQASFWVTMVTMGSLCPLQGSTGEKLQGRAMSRKRVWNSLLWPPCRRFGLGREGESVEQAGMCLEIVD